MMMMMILGMMNYDAHRVVNADEKGMSYAIQWLYLIIVIFLLGGYDNNHDDNAKSGASHGRT